jgi:hypothetical protein
MFCSGFVRHQLQNSYPFNTHNTSILYILRLNPILPESKEQRGLGNNKNMITTEVTCCSWIDSKTLRASFVIFLRMELPHGFKKTSSFIVGSHSSKRTFFWTVNGNLPAISATFTFKVWISQRITTQNQPVKISVLLYYRSAASPVHLSLAGLIS